MGRRPNCGFLAVTAAPPVRLGGPLLVLLVFSFTVARVRSRSLLGAERRGRGHRGSACCLGRCDRRRIRRMAFNARRWPTAPGDFSLVCCCPGRYLVKRLGKRNGDANYRASANGTKCQDYSGCYQLLPQNNQGRKE